MRTRLFLSLLLCIGLVGCNPDFHHSHYKKRKLFDVGPWERRRVSLFSTGTYRNPIIRKEARQKMIKPPEIILDEW